MDHFAAAALGAAVAFVLFHLFGGHLLLSLRAEVAASGAALSYFLTARALRSMQAQRRHFQFPAFRIADLEVADPGELLLTEQVELVLTEADRFEPVHAPAADELVLDDILAKLGPQARVVRLFDATAMPSPAQLNSRIERHLRACKSEGPPADASDALYEALAELRRSLR